MRVDVVRLRDGSVVHIRQVQSGDEALLAEGFARLSDESRQLRFLSDKADLTPVELRYLIEIDHHDHEAIGAVDPVDGRGLGVARYIRNVEDTEEAEVAVTVADEWQRRGLGTELLSRLTDRARQEGIRHFTGLVASDNVAVTRLLHDGRVGVRVTERDPDSVEYAIALPPRGLGDEIQALLRIFGRRQLKSPVSIQDTSAPLTPEDPAGQTPELGS